MTKKTKIKLVSLQWVTVLVLHLVVLVSLLDSDVDFFAGLYGLIFFLYAPIIVAGYGAFMVFNLFVTYFIFNSKGLFTQKKL